MTIINRRLTRNLAAILLLATTLLLISACAVKKEAITAQQDDLDLSLLQSLPKEAISYETEVRPVLQRRCVACHGCFDAPCQLKLSSPTGVQRVASKQKVMRTIANIKGSVLRASPDVAFIRVKRDGAVENDMSYTVIRDKAYKNVTSMFKDDKDTEARDYSNDSLTVVDWLEGSYPNFFFSVGIDAIEQFAEGYAALQNSEDYERFVSTYGIRRTNSDFWETADWFQDQYLRENPVQAGLFDLNRYQNR